MSSSGWRSTAWSRPVDLYFPATGQELVDRLRHASAAYSPVEVHEHPVSGDGLVDSWPRLLLQARALVHRVETYGWRLEEPDGRRMLPDKLGELGITGPDVSSYGHLTAAQAARIAAEAGVRRLVLTHFSQRHPDVDAFADEARAHFPDVHAARDLDRGAAPPVTTSPARTFGPPRARRLRAAIE